MAAFRPLQRLVFGSQANLPLMRASNEVRQFHKQQETETKTNVKQPKLVIFDKDGTLICFHTMWMPWAVRSAIRLEMGSGVVERAKVLELLGICPLQLKVRPGLLSDCTMDQIRQAFNKLLVNNKCDKEKAAAMVNECIDDSNSWSPAAFQEIYNIQTLFGKLQESDIKIAICTADNRQSTEMLLTKVGVMDMVDDVVCGDDKHSLPKPHPSNAINICNRLGIQPADTWMVGDTLADLGMARAAQLGAAVGVLSGVATESHLEPHADFLVNDVAHMLNIITEN